MSSSSWNSPDIGERHILDADEYLRELGGWEIKCAQLSPGVFVGNTQHVEFPTFGIIRKTTNRILLKTGCTPEGTCTIGMPLSQSSLAYHNGQRLSPGHVALLTSGAEFELRTPEAFDFLVVNVSTDTLSHYLNDQELETTGLLTTGKGVVFHSANTQQLSSTLLQVLDTANDAPEKLAQTAFLEESVMLAVANCIANRSTTSSNLSVRESRRRLVERAQHYLQRMLDHDILIADMCHELGTNPRTLQDAFNEVFGVTPNAFIKALRLNNVRRELKEPSKRNDHIGDIAAHWGFWHLSQFASDYRQAFGELPSETKQRACSLPHNA